MMPQQLEFQTELNSQNDYILYAMQRGVKLTKLMALTRFRTVNLGQRILELRRDGWNIQTTMVQTGTGKRIGMYFLPDSKCDCDTIRGYCALCTDVLRFLDNHMSRKEMVNYYD